MPGLLLTPETEFKTLKIKELHPTFAAEIEGVDFSKPLSDSVFEEIRAASAKVNMFVIRHGILDTPCTGSATDYVNSTACWFSARLASAMLAMLSSPSGLGPWTTSDRT
jgi:hypothetical protein